MITKNHNEFIVVFLLTFIQNNIIIHDMNNAILYMTVGIPGSGKSTYSTQFTLKNNIRYLNSDQLRAHFGTDETDQSVTPQVFRYIKSEVNKLLSENISVLVDSTAITKRNRQDFIDIAKKQNAKCEVIYFKIDIAVAKERNKSRSRVVPEFILDRMYNSLETPTISEGIDKIIVIQDKK